MRWDWSLHSYSTNDDSVDALQRRNERVLRKVIYLDDFCFWAESCCGLCSRACECCYFEAGCYEGSDDCWSCITCCACYGDGLDWIGHLN